MRTSCIVLFGQDGIAIREDIATITIQAGGTQSFANLDDLQNNTGASKPYATFETDFWLLDGNFKIAPVSGAHGGWTSTAKSGTTGSFNYSSAPMLEIVFNTDHDTDGLTLYFSEHSGDYADGVTITFRDSGGTLIHSDDYFPSSAVFSTGQAVSNFRKIEIEILSSNRAGRYARLMGIDFTGVSRFSGEQVKAAHAIQQIDPLSTELTIDTLDLTLFSDDGDFSIVNPAGVYANLQYKEPLDVYEDAGDIIYIGRFYLDEWESISENEATFKASDAIALLDEMDYTGSMSMPNGIEDAEDIILDIFDGTDISYALDASFNGIALRGWLPVSTKREALQQMCLALGAIATCARSSIVNIIPMELAEDVVTEDYTLTSADKGISSPLTLLPLVTGVEVDAHNYTSNGDEDGYEQVFVGTLTTGIHRIYFSNAPVWDTFEVNGVSSQYVVDQRSTYVELDIPSTQSVTVLATRQIETKIKYSVYNGSLPANTKSNIVRISDLTALASGLDIDPQVVTQRVYDYYQQRYLQKTRLFAHTMKPGDSVLVDVQGGAQMMGIVEKMDIDLAGGFVSDVEIVGILV